jgi:predicted DNA-binding ribbon-helix-helix protein
MSHFCSVAAIPQLPKTRWNRVRRKRGRPKVGQGFKRVSVSLEQKLLRRVTALAQRRGMSRSMLIAKALEQALAQEE